MRERKNKKNKMSKKTIIILIIVSCIVIPVIAYGSHLAYILYFSETPTFVDPVGEDVEIERPSDIPTSEESGIENIVLFGVDDRTATFHGRTDSIIIATIDKGNKVIKLTSIMRDMYVEIPDKGRDRINAAFVYGGPELTLKTINKNLGLDIKYYAIIDFKAFQEVVDILGGIDVEVKPYEVNEINYYIKEINGKNSTLLSKSGFQHLNGQQALSFARIRSVGNGDFERTERQRIVLKSLAARAKEVSALKFPQLVTTLASYVQTNIPPSKIASLGMSAYGFSGSIQSMRVPEEGYYQGQHVNGNAVLVPDIKANALFVKEFIYNVKLIGNKDMPSYMQNNFHMEDNVVASKPKPNIPNYSTPKITLKPEETDTIPTPGEPGTTPEDPAGTPEVTPTPEPTGTPGVTPTPGPEQPGGADVTPTPTPTPTGTPGATPSPTPTPTSPVTP